MNNVHAPHVRTEAKSRHMTRDILLTAIPLCIFSAINYGPRPVYIVLFSMAAALLSEIICCLFRRQSLAILGDGSAAVTGMLIGLCMSPMVNYWIPMLGSAFAIFIVKAPFGGYGRNVFNPAAAGLAMLSYCFPQQMFTYPVMSGANQLPVTFSVGSEVVTAPSLAAQLRADAIPTVSRLHLLLGDFVGPIGATATLILAACALYLVCRRTISLWVLAPYVLTCFIIAWLFPCTGLGRLHSTAAQLCAGYVLFTGVFLLNDPVTTPRFWLGRVFYGIFAGALVMLLQHIGRVEAGSCFAILMVNAIAPIIDRWSWHGLRAVTRLYRLHQEVKAHE